MLIRYIYHDEHGCSVISAIGGSVTYAQWLPTALEALADYHR